MEDIGSASDSSHCVIGVPEFDDSDDEVGDEDWSATLERLTGSQGSAAQLISGFAERFAAPVSHVSEKFAQPPAWGSDEPGLARLGEFTLWDEAVFQKHAHVLVHVEGPDGSADVPLGAFLKYASSRANLDMEACETCVVVETRWMFPRDDLRASLPVPQTLLDADLRAHLPEELRPRDEMKLWILPPTSVRGLEAVPEGLSQACLTLSGSLRLLLVPPGAAPNSDVCADATSLWQCDQTNQIEVTQHPGEMLVLPDGWAWAALGGPEISVMVQIQTLLLETAPKALPKLAQSAPRRVEALMQALKKIRPDVEMPQIFPATFPPPATVECKRDAGYRLQRIPGGQMTVAEFRNSVIPGSNPVILTGLNLTSVESMGLAVEFLREQLPPTLTAPMKIDGSNVPDVPMDYLFRSLDEGKDVYLADVSVADYFPWLFQHFKVPRYALHCFSHRTRNRHFASNKTPSLFIGGGRSYTPLHRDQLATNFWMYMCEGKKHWTAFHPDDFELLSPSWDPDDQIYRFPSLDDLRANPDTQRKLEQARRLNFDLEPGELLYIPQGTPHEVRNLCQAVALSGNFWDQSNLANALHHMELKLGQYPPGARHDNLKRLRDGLAEIEWPELAHDVFPGDDVPLVEFGGLFPAHALLSTLRPAQVPNSSA